MLELAELATRCASELADQVETVASLVRDTLEARGTVFFCGNGGSAADAQHLAAEYVVRFDGERGPLRAIALTTDTSVLTAAGNDLGFGDVFARQVKALGRRGDLLMVHSTSGESENLVRAVEAARSAGLRTVALLAKGGGRLKDVAEVAIVVPTANTARAQELHLTIGHAVCDWVNRSFSERSR